MLTKIKVYACYIVKIYKKKQTPKILKNRGARARRTGPGSAFVYIESRLFTSNKKDSEVHVNGLLTARRPLNMLENIYCDYENAGCSTI